MGLRLFFALWPDPPLREALVAWQQGALPPGVQPMHPLDLHLTLRFLGQVEAARVPGLLALGETLALPACTLRLDRVGHWPRPRVLWVGPSETPRALLDFQARLERAVQDLGFAPDPRPWRPHVTVARKARQALVGTVFSPLDWRPGQWALLESRPGARPLYHPLGRWEAKKISPQG